MEKQKIMTAEEFNSLMQMNVPQANKKVRNATRSERNGVMFDSRLERYMYDLLTMHNITFEFQKKYVIQEGFNYGNQTIRAITYTVDFELLDYDMAIDTKGLLTQQGVMRIKMLKRLFLDLGRQTKIELPRTKDECVTLIGKLLNNE